VKGGDVGGQLYLRQVPRDVQTWVPISWVVSPGPIFLRMYSIDPAFRGSQNLTYLFSDELNAPPRAYLSGLQISPVVWMIAVTACSLRADGPVHEPSPGSRYARGPLSRPCPCLYFA
jgi:hypothetical protein